ncbi:transcription termination factor 2 [Microcaecilia unicolor]|uniref:Transcription termination factor 2 n=1 Tax=Microcaecilia unicolor TaxID=1415580 RepID=A0A6P7Y7E4_9AMPH|nr:transcription termination factor 2 [Microcaecilia unicolor]
MQLVFCQGHGSLCVLKTGTRDGPSKEKSFYICGAHDKPSCGYVQTADIPASHCLLHEEFLVELQALVKQQDGTQYRLHYRCVKSKAAGKKWCGSVPWQDSTELPANGKSFHSLGKPRLDPERNPFKVKKEDQKPSLWKMDNEKRKEAAQSERDPSPDIETDMDKSWKKGLPMELKIKKKALENETTWTSAMEDKAKSIDKLQKEAGKQEEWAREKRDSEGDLTAQHRKQGTPIEEALKREGKSEHTLNKLEEQHTKLVKEGLPSDEHDKTPKNKGIKMKEDRADRSGKEIPNLNRNGAGQEQTDYSMQVAKHATEDSAVPPLTLLEKCCLMREKVERADKCNGTNQAELRKDKPLQEMKPQEVTHPVLKSVGYNGTDQAELRKDKHSQEMKPQKMKHPVPKSMGCNGTDQAELRKDKPSQEMKPQEVKHPVPKSVGCNGTDQAELRKDKPSQEMKPQEMKHPVPKSMGLGQKTITSFPGFVLASQENRPGLQDLGALHNHLAAQLKQRKATLASVNVQALPDKGQRLQRQVQELEDALSSISLSTPVENDRKESEMKEKQPADVRNPFSGTGPRPQSSVSLIKPQTFQDLKSQSLGSASTIGSSQVCGGKPQQESLYGRRMKEDSLFAVRNATSEAIDHLHKSLESCPSSESTVEDPAGLKVPLLLHQKQALAWLLWRETQKPQGGILADDMGLGKTLTMIALILTQKHREKREKKAQKEEVWISKQDSTLIVSNATLVICPASLIHHWKKEVDKRVDHGKLRVYLYHGPNREKDSQLLSGYDIVVTTYSLAAKEIPVQKGESEGPVRDQGEDGSRSLYSPLLCVTWRRIILDEAHTIKNPKAQTSLAMCKLRASARWAMTGTPIQNNLLDMYSLLKFLRCSPFDDFKVWKSQVDNCTKKGGERLIILTISLLLRRTKDQMDAAGKPLVPLPQRRYRLHQLKLSKDEQSVYNILYARSRSTLQSYLKRHEGEDEKAGRRADNPFDRVAQEFGIGQDDCPSSSQPQVSSTMHILTLLLRLRQCCSHLSLLKMSLDQVELKSEGIELSLEEQLSALTLSELHVPDPKSTVCLNGTSFPADFFENYRESTKITALMAELKMNRSSSEAQKSVIVSQWTSMLKVVAVHLKRIGLTYGVVDGSVNPKQRMDLVEEFNNNPKGPQVMLVSLCAGGVGLNLIGGNHLFLLDMHWNPALEDQACDRIYRVGQLKDVVIHRFVCEGTVEEKISALQMKKKELATQVLSGKGNAITKLTLADLKVLFGV